MTMLPGMQKWLCRFLCQSLSESSEGTSRWISCFLIALNDWALCSLHDLKVYLLNPPFSKQILRCWSMLMLNWKNPVEQSRLDFYCHVNLDVLISFLSSNCLRAAYALWWLCFFCLNAACEKNLWEPFRWWGECNCSFTYTSKVWQICHKIFFVGCILIRAVYPGLETQIAIWIVRLGYSCQTQMLVEVSNIVLYENWNV